MICNLAVCYSRCEATQINNLKSRRCDRNSVIIKNSVTNKCHGCGLPKTWRAWPKTVYSSSVLIKPRWMTEYQIYQMEWMIRWIIKLAQSMKPASKQAQQTEAGPLMVNSLLFKFPNSLSEVKSLFRYKPNQSCRPRSTAMRWICWFEGIFRS